MRIPSECPSLIAFIPTYQIFDDDTDYPRLTGEHLLPPCDASLSRSEDEFSTLKQRIESREFKFIYD